MNSRFLLIAFSMLGLAHTSLCQSVRWRFTIPTPAYQKDVSNVDLVGNDGSGGAVFRVTDYRTYPPESVTNGLATVGSYIMWLSRTGTLLHTMNIENLEGSMPYPTLVTPTVLQIQIPDSAGKPIRLHQAVRKGQGVTITEITPPADETFALMSTSINTVDKAGYFTFKKAGESITEIVRYGL